MEPHNVPEQHRRDSMDWHPSDSTGKQTWLARTWQGESSWSRSLLRGLEGTSFVFFGLTPWLGVNAVFVEAPRLAKELSGGSKLPALLGLAVQFGNIGPLCYIILRRKRLVGERPTIVLQLLAAFSASLLLSLSWQVTPWGVPAPLFALLSIGGLVGCTSSMTWQAYCGRFRTSWAQEGQSGRTEAQSLMNAGASVSGLLPVLLGAAQRTCPHLTGLGSVSSFFLHVAVLQLGGLLASMALEGPREAAERLALGLEPLLKPARKSPRLEDYREVRALSYWTGQQETTQASAVTVCTAFREFLGEAMEGNRRTGALLPKLLSEALNYSVLPGLLPYLGGGVEGAFFATECYYLGNVTGFLTPHAWIAGTATEPRTESADSSAPARMPGTMKRLIILQVLLAICLGTQAANPSKVPWGFAWVLILLLPVTMFGFLNGAIAVQAFGAANGDPELDRGRESINLAMGLITQCGAIAGTCMTVLLTQTGVFTT